MFFTIVMVIGLQQCEAVLDCVEGVFLMMRKLKVVEEVAFECFGRDREWCAFGLGMQVRCVAVQVTETG